jgi:hypothetical protein
MFLEMSVNGLISIKGQTQLADMNDICEYVKIFAAEQMQESIADQTDLNTQLEEVLKYGLYDDKSFNEMSAYYNKIVFGKNIEAADSVQILLGEGLEQRILEIGIDQGDEIPDELIEYAETMYGRRFGWNEAEKGITFGAFCKNLRKLIGFEP